MRTAQEMYQYCRDNNMGLGFSKGWALKHFALIEANLLGNEEVLMCFMGLHNYLSSSSHDGHFAYAVTNKRIIMAQKKPVGQIFQTVLLDNVNDVTFKSSVLSGTVTIDTIKETFNVYLDKSAAQNINAKLHDILLASKEPSAVPEPQASAPAQEVSAADEILKFKNLLDMGAITQEEFEAKKKQLLGLA